MLAQHQHEPGVFDASPLATEFERTSTGRSVAGTPPNRQPLLLAKHVHHKVYRTGEIKVVLAKRSEDLAELAGMTRPSQRPPTHRVKGRRGVNPPGSFPLGTCRSEEEDRHGMAAALDRRMAASPRSRAVSTVPSGATNSHLPPSRREGDEMGTAGSTHVQLLAGYQPWPGSKAKPGSGASSRRTVASIRPYGRSSAWKTSLSFSSPKRARS
jgi:hypothetical protein